MELVVTYGYWMGMGLLTLFLIALLKQLVYQLFPQEPPPLRDGESISSRVGKLRW